MLLHKKQCQTLLTAVHQAAKRHVLTMISRAVDAQKMNFQYTRTGATKIIPQSSLASPFSIIVQLPMFYDVIYLSTLTSSCRKTDVKEILFVQILLCQLRVKCKKENSFRQA